MNFRIVILAIGISILSFGVSGAQEISDTQRKGSLMLFNQGVELYKSGDLEGAIDKLELGLKIDPENPVAHYYFAEILVDINKNNGIPEYSELEPKEYEYIVPEEAFEHYKMSAKSKNETVEGVISEAIVEQQNSIRDKQQAVQNEIELARIKKSEETARNIQMVKMKLFANKLFKFAYVEGGCFDLAGKAFGSNMMGYSEGLSQDYEPICLKNYAVSKHLVTQNIWEAVMGYNPVNMLGVDRYYHGFEDWVGDEKPAVFITYNEVKIFIDAINEQSNNQFGYRIITDGEWEFACRDRGKEYEICGSYKGHADWSRYSATFRETFNFNNENGRSKELFAVGTKLPNNLGIYDMTGNGYEWTCSEARVYRYLHNKYKNIYPSVDPEKLWQHYCLTNYNDSSLERTIRGGSQYNAFWVPATNYNGMPEKLDHNSIFRFVGFRIGLDESGYRRYIASQAPIIIEVESLD